MDYCENDGELTFQRRNNRILNQHYDRNIGQGQEIFRLRISSSDRRSPASKMQSSDSSTVNQKIKDSSDGLDNEITLLNKRHRRQWSSSLKEYDSQDVTEMKDEYEQNLDQQEILTHKLQNSTQSLSKKSKRLKQQFDSQQQKIMTQIEHSDDYIGKLKQKHADIKKQEEELLKQLEQEKNKKKLLKIQLTDNKMEAKLQQALLISKNSIIINETQSKLQHSAERNETIKRRVQKHKERQTRKDDKRVKNDRTN
eukprot:403360289